MQAPSLAHALSCKAVPGAAPADPSPHSRVATPLRTYSTATPSRRTLAPAASPCLSPIPGLPSPIWSPQSSSAAGGTTPSPQPQQRTPAVTPIASPRHPAATTTSGGRRATGSVAVSVVAPGGGTGINGAVYTELGQDPGFAVDIVGRSRAPYDCYPEYWPNGGPAPNLATFAEDVLRQGWVEKSDCFVFGSRGGQVVLPILWERMRERMPPVVCINGGCAMGLPRHVHWPNEAVTFLLIGGQDYFRGKTAVEQYIAETKSRVPQGNATTAILFVHEMEHMPKAALLRAVLPSMLKAVMKWKAAPGSPPRMEFRSVLERVHTVGWRGRLMYTKGCGEWAPDVDFSPFHVTQHVATAEELEASQGSSGASCEPAQEPIQVTRKAELKDLLRAAVHAVQPGGGVPLAHPADKFAAAAQAAKNRGVGVSGATVAAGAVAGSETTTPGEGGPPKSPGKLQLPPGSMGQGGGGGGGGTTGAGRLALPIARAGAASIGGQVIYSPSGTSSNHLQVPAPTMRSQCAAPVTPISRALGITGTFYGTPTHSQRSLASTVASPFADAGLPLRTVSPMRPPPIVVVRS